MKVLSFLRWKFRQSTFEDICCWTGAALIGAGFGSDNQYFYIAGVFAWMTIFVKYLINHYKREYQEFKEEQNQLFDTIKNSDKK